MVDESVLWLVAFRIAAVLRARCLYNPMVNRIDGIGVEVGVARVKVEVRWRCVVCVRLSVWV